MNLLKITLIATACILTVSCVSTKDIEIKNVDCTAHMFEGLDNRHYEAPLTKYAPQSKRFYAEGSPLLGLHGWMRIDEFDKITCKNSNPLEE